MISEKEERKLRHELSLRKEWMDKLPFCPDHRDKVKGKPCRECEIEELYSIIRLANSLIFDVDTDKVSEEWDNSRRNWAARILCSPLTNLAKLTYPSDEAIEEVTKLLEVKNEESHRTPTP